MILMGIVSMWTTYVSLYDSILPKPLVTIPIGNGKTWTCSIFALALSLAIGLMLFALKKAIIDEQKRLNLLGIAGLTIVGFISISFNMDVLYRTADQDFFMRFSNERMRDTYLRYLSEVQAKLSDKRMELLKIVARQEGELEAEVKGLRKAPAGYGPLAKKADYELTLMQKQATVELETITEALKSKEKADRLLASKSPTTADEVQQLQNDLRLTLKDMGAVAGVPLPSPILMESPLFTVFKRLFDYRTLGMKEIFFLAIAFFLDLGDILGYSLVPNRREKKLVAAQRAIPLFRTPELLAPPPEVEDEPKPNGAQAPDTPPADWPQAPRSNQV